MVIEPAREIRFPCRLAQKVLVLACVQEGRTHVLAVVQHVPAQEFFLVVHVDDGGLAVGAHAVVIEKARGGKAHGLELPGKLGVLGCERLVVLQPRVEKIRAVLHVAHARLPEHVQKVDALDGDIAEAARLFRVPAHAVDARAGLELLPHPVGVGLLKGVLLQDHGQDLREDARLGPVVGFARQDVRLGVGVHGVSVLGDDHVMQPPGHGLKAVGGLMVLSLLGAVAELPPVFRLHGAPLDAGLPGLVLLQNPRKFRQPLFIDRQGKFFVHCLFETSVFSCRGDS